MGKKKGNAKKDDPNSTPTVTNKEDTAPIEKRQSKRRAASIVKHFFLRMFGREKKSVENENCDSTPQIASQRKLALNPDDLNQLPFSDLVTAERSQELDDETASMQEEVALKDLPHNDLLYYAEQYEVALSKFHAWSETVKQELVGKNQTILENQKTIVKNNEQIQDLSVKLKETEDKLKKVEEEIAKTKKELEDTQKELEESKQLMKQMGKRVKAGYQWAEDTIPFVRLTRNKMVEPIYIYVVKPPAAFLVKIIVKLLVAIHLISKKPKEANKEDINKGNTNEKEKDKTNQNPVSVIVEGGAEKKNDASNNNTSGKTPENTSGRSSQFPSNLNMDEFDVISISNPNSRRESEMTPMYKEKRKESSSSEEEGKEKKLELGATLTMNNGEKEISVKKTVTNK